MSGVDDRIVTMGFQNSQFERGVRTTLGSLDKLKKSLDFKQSNKGIDNVQKSVDHFNTNHMSSGIDGVSKKFIALGTIGVTALANITNKAINAGTTLLKSLTVAPITAGLHEYETQLGSIQTILANTGLEGKSGLAKVNGALQELNTYSDKTIYNFGQMAKNIGTFTAAGVSLPKSTSAIKGIANLAALSGSNADQASTAMYQLSQAIANNKVGLQDWNSVVNAGMGGKVFQKALFNMAMMKGTLKDVDAGTTFEQWTKAGNSFRDSLKQGWITGEVLTDTLSTFTGDLTDAQLKSMGFNREQIASIQKQAKTAQDAATKVKTMTQLLDTLKESVGSGWAQTWQIVFGNFDEAKTLFTGLSNSIGGVIQASAKARNKLLSDWKKLGGRTALIDGLKNAFKALSSVVTPIKQAFRQIFPRETGQQLADLTKRFRDFMERLKIGPETADRLKRTFAGFFAIFSIGKQIFLGFYHVFTQVFSAVTKGSGNILKLTARIGDFFVKIDKNLKTGDGFMNFFNNLADALLVPVQALTTVRDLITGLFTGFSGPAAKNVQEGITAIGDSLSQFGLNTSGIKRGFSNLWDKIQPKLQPIIDFFKHLGHNIAEAIKNVDFSDVTGALNTGLLAGIALMLKRFFDGFGEHMGGGVLDKVKGVLGGLTQTLHTMQTQIKANILLTIAKAVALLTGSVSTIALMNKEKVKVGLKAIGAMFGELLISMSLMTKLLGFKAAFKLPFVAAGIVALASSIAILTAAVVPLSLLDWKHLSNGLSGLAGMLTILTIASKALSKNPFLIITGAALIEIATALDIMSVALVAMSFIPWENLGRGLAGIAGALVAIGVGLKFLPKVLIITMGVGLNAIAVALNIMYLAVLGLSHIGWEAMARGLVGVAGGLTAIALGLKFMPKWILLQALALNAVATSLGILSFAIAKMGGLSFETIAKGLGTIGASMVIIAGGLRLMAKSKKGALAFALAAGAIALLAPAMKILGTMDLKELAIALGAIAGSFVVLAGAGRLLTGAVPGLLGLGGALLLIGGAVAAAGAGIWLISTALTSLASTGMAGIKVLIEGIKAFVTLIPDMIKAFAEAFVAILHVISDNGPTMVKAFSEILGALLQAIIVNTPGALKAFIVLLDAFLKAVVIEGPKIVSAGLQLVIDILKGITNKMPSIIKAGADLIVAFLKGIGNNIDRIIEAGLVFIVKFLNGLAKGIEKHLPEILKAGARIGIAIVKGLWNGIWGLFGAGGDWLGDRLGEFWDWIWKKIKKLFGISSPSKHMAYIGEMMIHGLWNGIKNAAGWLWNKVKDVATKVGDKLIPNLSSGNLGKELTESNLRLAKAHPDKYILDKYGNLYYKKSGNLAQKANNKAVENIYDALDNISKTLPKSSTPTVGGAGGRHSANSVGVRPLSSGSHASPSAVINISTSAPDVSGLTGLIGAHNARTASLISSNTSTNSQNGSVSQNPVETKEISFTQINQSPKALSAIEIYRQTRNQLSMAKGAF